MGLFSSDEEDVKKELVARKKKAYADRTRLVQNNVEAHRNATTANLHRSRLAQNEKKAAELEKMAEATAAKMRELEEKELNRKRELDAEEEILKRGVDREQKEDLEDVKRQHEKKRDEHKAHMERLRQEQASINENIEAYNKRYLEENTKETEKTDKLNEELRNKDYELSDAHNKMFYQQEERKLQTELAMRQDIDDKEAEIYEKTSKAENALTSEIVDTQKARLLAKIVNVRNANIREVNDAITDAKDTLLACNNSYGDFSQTLAMKMDAGIRSVAKTYLQSVNTQVSNLSKKLEKVDDKKRYIAGKEEVEQLNSLIKEAKKTIREFETKSRTVYRKLNKPETSTFKMTAITSEIDGLDIKMQDIVTAIGALDLLSSRDDDVVQAVGSVIQKRQQQITDK